MVKEINTATCRKIKPSDPKGEFIYPSAEYADDNRGQMGECRKYLQEVKEHFGDDIEGTKKEIEYFLRTYSNQHKWFTNSIVKQDLKERRREWCGEQLKKLSVSVHAPV